MRFGINAVLSTSKEEQSAAALAVRVPVARRPMLKALFIPERQFEDPKKLNAVVPTTSRVRHLRRSGVGNVTWAQSQVDMGEIELVMCDQVWQPAVLRS